MVGSSEKKGAATTTPLSPAALSPLFSQFNNTFFFSSRALLLPGLEPLLLLVVVARQGGDF